MARDTKNLALALADDALDLTSKVDALEASSSGCFPLLPPALPADELDLIGPDSDVLSLAALEAAFDSLPFGDDEPCDVMVFFESDAPAAPASDDGVPESKRPTRPYSTPGVPPCMRSTSRPAAQARA